MGTGDVYKRQSLGYKKEEDNPWEKLKNEYPIGSEFEAPVLSLIHI